MTEFHGLPTRRLDNGHMWLEYLTGAGPRIVRMGRSGSDANLLADLDDIRIPTVLGEYRLYGGHRLWHSPEAMPRSYVPDNEPVEVTEVPGGVRLTQKIEAYTGVRKSIEIQLSAGEASARLTHRLENDGVWPVELAAWALSKMRQGGLAVFPQVAHKLEESGLLPNRNLVLWPYTRLADPRLSLNDDFVLIDAKPLLPPCKIGYLNRHGWLGYLIDGLFFVKSFQPEPDQPHVDYGCNTESYIGDRMIELETVSPLHRLEPGAAFEHVEEWRLHPASGTQASLAAIRELVPALGLPNG